MKKQKPNFFKDAWYGRLPPVSVWAMFLLVAVLAYFIESTLAFSILTFIENGFDTALLFSNIYIAIPISLAVLGYLILHPIFFVWFYVSLWRCAINADLSAMKALHMFLSMAPAILLISLFVDGAFQNPFSLVLLAGGMTAFFFIKGFIGWYFKESTIERAGDSMNSIRSYA